MDGLGLSVIIGLLVAIMLVAIPTTVAGWFGASGAVAEQAGRYLRITGFGVPAMLATMAITGVLRGFQDTRTPLVVTVITFSANLVLNLWFVLGMGWGIQGSAIGTLVCQIAMAVALVWVLRIRTRGLDLSLVPHLSGIASSLRDGIPLLIRTLALRAALYVTTWVAARSGAITMASYQVTMTMWNLLLMAMDALGIAGQALTGASLGAGDVRRTRSLTATMTRWGLWRALLLASCWRLFIRWFLPCTPTTPPYTERSLLVCLSWQLSRSLLARLSSSMGCSLGLATADGCRVLRLSCSWCIYRWPGLCTSWRRQTRPLQWCGCGLPSAGS